MGVNPLSRKETHTLIACLLAAIEDPSNPPEEDERDQLITSSQRWLEMDEAQFKSYAEVGWQPGPDVDPGICQFEAVEGEPGYLHGRLREKRNPLRDFAMKKRAAASADETDQRPKEPEDG